LKKNEEHHPAPTFGENKSETVKKNGKISTRSQRQSTKYEREKEEFSP